ncbi:MAG: DUF3276 family protein [Alistipes sp.]|nr:DUF3276 family protein [Alistipes sp.]
MTNLNVPRHESEDYGDLIHSKVVRAGKRTYFFDVKSTRNDDYYITLTESRKKTHDDGSSSYSRHQIYLYKEDFEKFLEGMNEAMEQIRQRKPEYFNSSQTADK